MTRHVPHVLSQATTSPFADADYRSAKEHAARWGIAEPRARRYLRSHKAGVKLFGTRPEMWSTIAADEWVKHDFGDQGWQRERQPEHAGGDPASWERYIETLIKDKQVTAHHDPLGSVIAYWEKETTVPS